MNKTIIEVTIQGISPLLMHRHTGEDRNDKDTPISEAAESCAYRDPDTGRLYIPAQNMHRALVSSGAYIKLKGKRGATASKSIAACVYIAPERIDLGVSNYTVDTRTVVIQAARGARIARHRPRIDQWKATFYIEYDSELISGQDVRDCVDAAGSRVGILDYRPERKGPFGRFVVVSWKERANDD